MSPARDRGAEPAAASSGPGRLISARAVRRVAGNLILAPCLMAIVLPLVEGHSIAHAVPRVIGAFLACAALRLGPPGRDPALHIGRPDPRRQGDPSWPTSPS
ncbi:hypothetical protein [Nonomuraea sp. NPDC050783]|uniref:hypothetical protein n=1 Tax=Nonomuraea sp. NPDC050783 TaxID=3154634 RepID=UPI0034660364